MAQQTAVNWLIEHLRQLAHNPETKYQEWGEAFEQARQMEKEQIIHAWREGDNDSMYAPKELDQQAEQYYNETYNK